MLMVVIHASLGFEQIFVYSCVRLYAMASRGQASLLLVEIFSTSMLVCSVSLSVCLSVYHERIFLLNGSISQTFFNII